MSIQDLYTENTLVTLNKTNTGDFFQIDEESRSITPPADFKYFGVESDEKTTRIWFECPQFVGDNIDLSKLGLRVNYKNANGDLDQYIVTDVEANGETIVFSWLLSRKCTLYKGTVSFIVCAVKTDINGEITNEWNTAVCKGDVLEGLEVESPEAEEVASDLIAQLIEIVNGATARVEDTVDAGVSRIETAKDAAIQMVQLEGGTAFANAIRETVKGEKIHITDISPIEHTVGVKLSSDTITDFSTCALSVQGKNWFNNDTSLIKQLKYTSSSGSYTRYGYAFYLPAGTYTIRAIAKEAVFSDVFLYGYVLDKDWNVKSSSVHTVVNNACQTTTFTISEGDILIQVDGTTGQLSNAKAAFSRFDIQLEEGEVKTEFESYKGKTYTPNADGTVDGVKSISPTMILMVDTKDVIIEAEYNQDINKVMDNVKVVMSSIDTALDEISEIQNSLIGGDGE